MAFGLFWLGCAAWFYMLGDMGPGMPTVAGVGLMGLQIAKLRGAKLVIGTSTSDARRARLSVAELLQTRDADQVLSAIDIVFGEVDR